MRLQPVLPILSTPWFHFLTKNETLLYFMRPYSSSFGYSERLKHIKANLKNTLSKNEVARGHTVRLC
jgi:hypothetical protein